MIVSGKNLGTNGIGPDMEAVSLVALASLSSRSRRAARVLRRMMLIAIPKEKMLNTPTLPPRAPANVATLLFFSLLWTNIRTLILPGEVLKYNNKNVLVSRLGYRRG